MREHENGNEQGPGPSTQDPAEGDRDDVLREEQEGKGGGEEREQRDGE